MTLAPAKQAFPNCFRIFKMLIKILSHFNLYCLVLYWLKYCQLLSWITFEISMAYHNSSFSQSPRGGGGKGHGEREEVVFWSIGTQADERSTIFNVQKSKVSLGVNIFFIHMGRKRGCRRHTYFLLGMEMTHNIVIHSLSMRTVT